MAKLAVEDLQVAETGHLYTNRPVGFLGRDLARKRRHFIKQARALNRDFLASRIPATRIVRATPPWADREAIKAIYARARALGMEVDHVVPLNGETVCGLHVETNLQLLPPDENRKKSNHWFPGCAE